MCTAVRGLQKAQTGRVLIRAQLQSGHVTVTIFATFPCNRLYGFPPFRPTLLAIDKAKKKLWSTMGESNGKRIDLGKVGAQNSFAACLDKL